MSQQSHLVDLFNYFLFQPVLHNLCNKGCGLWDGAYKRSFAAVHKLFLSRTEELVKTGTCARNRRALQQLALNVHIKHSDLTCPQKVAYVVAVARFFLSIIISMIHNCI